MLTFGPIPSRRLGRSLGVNNIPPKYCSYYCVYCQIGTVLEISTERREFYKPNEIIDSVIKKVEEAEKREDKIDYISFVPDGEPTLDKHLGFEIREIKKKTGVPVAVITNSSTLWDEQVRKDLMAADWVSVKVDSLDEKIWRKINHPSRKLDLEQILEGTRLFASEYKGKLMTETMLIRDMNDREDILRSNAEFIGKLNPHTSFLGIPTRPPARSSGQPPAEEKIAMAYQVYKEKINHVETLLGYEGNAYSASGDAETDLLSIISVHPMRRDAVEDLLKNDNANWDVIEKLIKEDQIREIHHQDHVFYVRKLRK